MTEQGEMQPAPGEPPPPAAETRAEPVAPAATETKAQDVAEPLEEKPDLPFPLQEDEVVYANLRRHWMTLYPKTLFFLVLAFVPTGALFGVLSAIDILDDGIVQTIAGILSALWIVYWIARGLLNWYRYHNDVWVVTDQRIVDSHRKHPLNLEISSADLVDVVDTNIRRSGIFNTALNYGDVRCQTAGSSTNFVLGDIPHPGETQMLIDRLRDVARQELGRR
ncbi:MAG TPA: hypothetical protein VFZ12_07685 [Dehalococcoidia bacterium]|nr:hypothetical protein [Dehalococcoidia bacterium]